MEVAVFKSVINSSLTRRTELKEELTSMLDKEQNAGRDGDSVFLKRIHTLLNNSRAMPDWCWTRTRCCFFTTSGSRLRQDLKNISHSLRIKLSDLLKIQSDDPLQKDPLESRNPLQYYDRAEKARTDLASMPVHLDGTTLHDLRVTKRVLVYNLIKYIESTLALPDGVLIWEDFSKMRQAIKDIRSHINNVLMDEELIRALSYRIDDRQAEVYFERIVENNRENIWTHDHPNPTPLVGDITSSVDLLAKGYEPTKDAIKAQAAGKPLNPSILRTPDAAIAHKLGFAEDSQDITNEAEAGVEPAKYVIHDDYTPPNSDAIDEIARVKAIFINKAHEWLELSQFRFSNFVDAVRLVTRKKDNVIMKCREWDLPVVKDFLKNPNYQKQHLTVPTMISLAEYNATEAVRHPGSKKDFQPASVYKDSVQDCDLGVKIAKQHEVMSRQQQNPLTKTWFYRKVAQLLRLLFDMDKVAAHYDDKNVKDQVQTIQVKTIIDKCKEQAKLPSILIPENFPNVERERLPVVAHAAPAPRR